MPVIIECTGNADMTDMTDIDLSKTTLNIKNDLYLSGNYFDNNYLKNIHVGGNFFINDTNITVLRDTVTVDGMILLDKDMINEMTMLDELKAKNPYNG
jgi:hypothetical protein